MSEDDVGDDSKSYEVGYRKPPSHSRFKAGQSGNPKGKQNGSKSYKSIVSAALQEKISVRTARGSKRVSKLEALIQTRLNKGLKGDGKAADQVFRIAREVGLTDEIAEAVDAATMKEISEEDREILERFRNRIGATDPGAGE